MIELNHTIVWCKDQKRSSAFLAEMLGSARTDALRAFRRHHLGEWYFNGFREQRRADHAAALRVSDHRSGVRRRAGADQGAGPGLLG